MSFSQRHYSKKKKSYKSSLSINLIAEKRSFSFNYQSDICLNKKLYKINTKKYNDNLLVLNYIINCSQKKYSAKTALSDSTFNNYEYDLNMIKKYKENSSTSLSFISNFDLEGFDEENPNSFNSEKDDDSFEKTDIKSKNNKKIKNYFNNDDDINDQLNKDFIDIKNMLLGKNVSV